MVKYTHLFLLSGLIIWLAVSGCIGNDTSNEKEAGTISNYTETKISSTLNNSLNDTSNGVSAEELEVGLTQAEIRELDADMSDLQNLLEKSDAEEGTLIKNAENAKSENLTGK